MTERKTTRPVYVLVAIVATIVLALAGIGLITLDLLEQAGGRRIEEAPQPPLTITLVSLVALIVAAAWTIWLVRDRGIRNILSAIAAVVTVALLVATPVLGWQAMNSDRDLTVVTNICSAESLRNTSSNLRDGCEETAVDTIVLLEGVKSDDSWAPDETTGNLTRIFRDIPGGNVKTRITVDGPDDAVTVTVVAERDGKQVKLGTLRPYADAESERLRWSGTINIDGDMDNLQVLFFVSENEAVESASVRFNVLSCDGQNAQNFDASRCEPLDPGSPLVYEKEPEGARTWRQLHVFRQGESYVVSNLEARTYTLEPDYVSIENSTQSTSVVIIPAAMEQVPENSITSPGESSFEIQIDSNTGELTYNVYVFPTGPTYASAN